MCGSSATEMTSPGSRLVIPCELDGVIAQLKGRVDGLSVIDAPMLIANAGRIAAAAARHRLPAIGFREYVEAGGLMAYGVNIPQIWRRSMSLESCECVLVIGKFESGVRFRQDHLRRKEKVRKILFGHGCLYGEEGIEL